MDLESIAIPATNTFSSLYIHHQKPVTGYFHYDMTKKDVYQERYADLMNRQFPRSELAECIGRYMNQFPLSSKVEQSLEKLRDPSSVVVMGGQQAGLLTGPLYSIHKIVSIIVFAGQQEQKLGVPVVPVFWIAGEDHDFFEVNHAFAPAEQEMKKISYPILPEGKLMTSHITFEKSVMKKWIREVVEQFGEKEYTNSLLHFLDEACEATGNFTDFFAYLIQSMFKNYGLLLIDAADVHLRKLERTFFTTLIDRHREITEAVLYDQNQLQQDGFTKMIDLEKDCANLFYYENGERLLLEYNQQLAVFHDKKNNVSFTLSQLFDLLEQYPERFSNNVVTRPLMQEWLFPTLAFIGGPGEIAYWGELKTAFEAMEMKMPPIVPRLNLTYVDNKIERHLKDLDLTFLSVLQAGTSTELSRYLEAKVDPQVAQFYENLKRSLEDSYASVEGRLAEIDGSLVALSEKNLAYHFRQLDYLENKVKQSLERKYESRINKYRELEMAIRPNGGPQERTWNIFYYINERGFGFIEEIMRLPYEFDGTHKIIRI